MSSARASRLHYAPLPPRGHCRQRARDASDAVVYFDRQLTNAGPVSRGHFGSKLHRSPDGGKTWEEVRDELGISKSTVRMLVTRIRNKCNVAHRPPREGLTEVYYRVVQQGVGL